jgi:hypoxanthine phosphoribosyltransferase
MRVSSYGRGMTSSGIVSLMGDAPDGVKGEPVLLVDDIQDTGRTLAFTRDFLLERGAERVWTCTLLDKPSRREVAGGEVDFVGFTIPDVFVVGYGIDYAERYRELPFIGRVELGEQGG